MAIIRKLTQYNEPDATTMAGVVDSTATYEMFDGYLIIRTSTNDTVHISKDIGMQLVNLLKNAWD